MRRLLSIIALSVALVVTTLLAGPASAEKYVSYKTDIITTAGPEQPTPFADRTFAERKGDKMRATLAARTKPTRTITSADVSPQAYEYYTVDECRSTVPGQYWKHHFAYCYHTRRTVRTLGCTTPTTCGVIGTRNYRLIVLGKGSRTTDTIDFFARVDDWKSEGTNLTGTLAFQLNCRFNGTQGETTCSDRSPTFYYREAPIEEWMTILNDQTFGGKFDLSIYGGTGADKVHYHQLEFTNSFKGFGTTGSGWSTIFGPDINFRCDKASYVNSACIFDNIEAYFGVIRSANPESAEHFELACYGPGVGRVVQTPTGVEVVDGTVPAKLGAKIAGQKDCNTSGAPLTRNYYNTALQTASYNKAVANCKAIWGDGYSQGGTYHCDEYPFNSTHQASAAHTDPTLAWWWSSRVILGSDNSSLGSKLAAWYRNDHIIDGDPFWIAIVD